jgi:predicted dehydrogenase
MLACTASDVLVIAAEPRSHAQLVALGAGHRQHVVCEKPLTLSAAQHQLVSDALADAGPIGLVPVHQYRYSPAWQVFGRTARLADRLGLPFFFEADVRRNGTDTAAVSAWRTDAASSGGMLADHGVHFLALAWTISRDLEPVAATWSPGRGRGERAIAHLRLGSGQMRVHLSSISAQRSTRIALRLCDLGLNWHDADAAVTIKGRRLGGWGTAAISDRDHVNTLYIALYADLARSLADPAWRSLRTEEALAVSRALITLLAERRPRKG